MLVNYFQGETRLLFTEAASKAAALPSSDELARLSRVCAKFSSSVAVLLLSSGEAAHVQPWKPQCSASILWSCLQGQAP